MTPVLVINSGSSSFHKLWWVCMPEPLSPNIGLGLKLAT